ncbi:gliding motility-associated C-terminal domain-containing protein [Mucilaginibacter endophyticus]|uniref:T9SS type B sorting domain-containing protein n=1 Tax=Mucilaginibacter endophyticus TaxID=2675003 RepID=UPI000E0DA7FE|nr:gliding motility-associated C-terminal domain-containing protein [Mucilaginibacter endophyticus]
MHTFLKPAIAAIALWLIALSTFGQAPDITYTTPNVYILGAEITLLSPSNTGGAVPATIYCETKIVAGTGQFGNVNGDAAAAQFKLPYGISMDAEGNTYIAESGGGIRMISASGQVSSIAADALPGPPFNVPKLNNPRGVVKDKSGNLFVANYSNHNILKITPAGIITVFAGINQSGTADGPGDVANIINPNGIAIDKDDNLYVSDGNNAIRKISPSGYVYTLAGQPAAGTLDGVGPGAKFNKPAGLAVDKDGNIYVADPGGFVIRKITPNGLVTTIAGSGSFGTGDGNGAAANFQFPVGITVDPSGNLYVTDGGVGTVRRISPDGEVKTIAGGGPVGAESGVGANVHFSSPSGITIGPDGNLYVAEYGKNAIKRVIATGYTIDKALPAGLVFDPKTGIITGTPTVLWPATNYTVTAYNAAGSSKFIMSIEVDDVAKPVINGSSASGTITACVGTASANYQTVLVAGTNLTNDAIVIAPANFEVSLTPLGGYGSTVIIPLADLELPPDGDGIAVYVRSAATAPAGNLTGTVLLKSAGATDIQVPVSGMVSQIMTLGVSINQQILGCPGEQVILVALTPNPPNNLNYQWYVNGNPRGGNSVNFISSEISSTDVITVTMTNTVDCTTSPSVTSAPASPMYIPLVTPLVTAEQPDLACPGESVMFVANTHGTENVSSAYRWEINNIDQHNNSKTFQAPATITAGDRVTVTLTNTSVCGPLSATSASISPMYIPVVPPVVTVEQPDLACLGQSVMFVANSHGTETANSVYRWEINNIDQHNGNKTFPAPVTITAADKVTVTLTNTSDCGPLSATSAPVSPEYTTPVVPPVVTVEQPNLACPGQSVMFVANTHGTEVVNSAYRWEINNIDQHNNNKTFTAPVTITAADKVTVTLTNTSDCGPLSATSAPVSPEYTTPVVPPVVTVEQPNLACPGQSVMFVANTHGTEVVNSAYRWEINNIDQHNNNKTFTAPVTITAADKVTVTLTNTSDCGPLSATSAPVSPEYTTPVVLPVVTVEQPDLACPGQSVMFVANTHGTEVANSAYRWEINNIDQHNNNKTFTAPATITAIDKVSVTLTNTSDCGPLSATSSPISPSYNSPLTPIVTINHSSFYPACEGIDQTFTAASPNPGVNPNYQWQLNHVNVGGNSDKFKSSTLKNGDVLTCTISSSGQCAIPGISKEFFIQTNELPTVAFNGNVTIKKGESITLSPILSNGIVNYSWSPSVGLSNLAVSSPNASPTVTTTYTLTVASAGGCQASASIKVNVLEQMLIPNAFTPNGDGVNDTWRITGLAAYPNCTVNVFNRYGAGIFRSVGYSKDWNGSFNGYVLPSGTYYYVVDLKDGNKPLSGYVVLLK